MDPDRHSEALLDTSALLSRISLQDRVESKELLQGEDKGDMEGEAGETDAEHTGCNGSRHFLSGQGQ